MALFDLQGLAGLLGLGGNPQTQGNMSFYSVPGFGLLPTPPLPPQSQQPAQNQGLTPGSAAPPLPPAQTISKLPTPVPYLPQQNAALPPGAQPAGPATPAQPPSQPSSMNPLSAIFGSGGMGLLNGGGLPGAFQSAFQAVMPQQAQLNLQHQILQAQLQSLSQIPGMTTAKAIAIIQNPKLQEQMFGNPTSVGEAKFGPNLSVPVVAQGGNTSYAMPSGGAQGLGQMAGLGNELSRTAAASEALGKSQGTNLATLPNALAQADQAIKLIDNIKGDPNLSMALGPLAGRLPAMGGPQADVVQKIDQLKGQAFLQAWQSLKGAGARITNTESMRATDAIGRLSRVQSTEGFNKALDDLRQVIVDVRTRAGTMAGAGPTPPQASSPQAAAPSFTQDQLLAEARRRGLVK